MASNPFEDEDGIYLVLRNAEGQYSLWPAGMAAPDGWEVALPSRARQECLDYIDSTWTDMRPLSLVRAMSEHAQAGGPA
jgi:MbtH protein